MQIAERTVAMFHYTLKNANGEILDSSDGAEPLPYLHGAGNIVPGLEAQMLGKSAGDKFQAIVPPALGYGEHDQSKIQQIPKSVFPAGQPVEVGMQFGAQTPQGPLAITIAAIEGDMITIDGNHPLAGVTLHFDIEVVDVRDATLEENLHGHAHGTGEHHH